MRSKHPRAKLIALRDFLTDHLHESIMPFWLEHAIDAAGGINTCIADDGQLVSREKWLWSQWRAVWVMSELARDQPGNPQWLKLARHICDFSLRHGWNEKAGGWRLLVDHEGHELRGCESIYVDAFAIYGLTALSSLDDDPALLEHARRTADHVLEVLKRPHDQIPHFPYPIPPGARVHGIPMMFSQVLWELGQRIDSDRYRAAALSLSDEIFWRFYDAKRDVILERVAERGGQYPGRDGTAVVPGHVIEDMWFQMHIARDRGDDRRIGQCIRLMARHFELGWDSEYGGLLLGIDADEGCCENVGWANADAKLWWPQTEAMYACLLAYEHTGDAQMLELYGRVHDYAFANYPLPEHGEWRQRLNRRGQPITKVIALPVKDPFHLPRALILSIRSLDRITQAT